MSYAMQLVVPDDQAVHVSPPVAIGPVRIGDPVAPRADVELGVLTSAPRAGAGCFCAAVIPLPQYAAAIGPYSRRRSRELALGALTAPGMWPATGSIGSCSPRNRSGVRTSSSTPRSAKARTSPASTVGSPPGVTVNHRTAPASRAPW